MQQYQNHIVFRSFSDLYTEERREEERRSIRSNNSSRASSFSEAQHIPSMGQTSYNNNLMRNNNTRISLASNSTDSDVSPQYYPAGLYNSNMARREADSVTLNDDISSVESQGLSLRRF